MMGIDGGTGGIRVGLYDRSGNCLSFAMKEYATAYPRPGYVEQDPADWWKTLKETVSEALNKGQISKDQLSAMAFDTTCTSVVVCRKDGTPLRPCIIWMDVRAAREAEELFEKTSEFYSPEWMPPKLAWLKRNEKEIYDAAEVFCEYQDWLAYKLTGKWCMNNNTACNWAYSINDGFSRKIYAALDIDLVAVERIFNCTREDVVNARMAVCRGRPLEEYELRTAFALVNRAPKHVFLPPHLKDVVVHLSKVQAVVLGEFLCHISLLFSWFSVTLSYLACKSNKKTSPHKEIHLF